MMRGLSGRGWTVLNVTDSTGAFVTAEEALWIEQGQRVYRYLYRLIGDVETARDLTQETFLQAIRSLRAGRGATGENATGWLYRIATNRAIDYFRRRRLIRWLPFLAERDGGSAPDSTERLAEQDLVLRALRRLPPETAALLLLRDGESFGSREIAEMLGEKHEAVRKRIARGREAFRIEYLRLKGDE